MHTTTHNSNVQYINAIVVRVNNKSNFLKFNFYKKKNKQTKTTNYLHKTVFTIKLISKTICMMRDTSIHLIIALMLN